MKYLIIPIFNLLVFYQAVGQKKVSRHFDAGSIKQLEIYADEVFQIEITTTGRDRVMVRSVSEGEYYNDISLDVEMLQDKMIISSRFPANLQGGYDKLSAHKIFSVKLLVEIPEDLGLYVESNIAAVTATGKYKSLQVQLRSGFCRLDDFQGNALIHTYSGPIDVITQDSTIEAISRMGKLDLPPKNSGKYFLKLQSVTGNIRVREN